MAEGVYPVGDVPVIVEKVVAGGKALHAHEFGEWERRRDRRCNGDCVSNATRYRCAEVNVGTHQPE